MFCPRCLNEQFEYVEPAGNIIHAEHRFQREDRRDPDSMPGPSLRCERCGLVFVNHGDRLEIEPDFLTAA